MSSRDSGNRLGQEQQLALRQTLSMQQVRYVHMLEMTDAEVAQDIRRELDENPALEQRESESLPAAEVSEVSADLSDGVSDTGPMLHPAGASTSRAEFFQPPAASESLYEVLINQLETLELPAVVKLAARYIIGNIDSNGYLRRSLDLIATDMALDDVEEPAPEEMLQALQAVRSMEPVGVGAEDIRQSMELQLMRRKPAESVNDALEIVRRRFDDLSSRRFSRLLPLVKGSRERLEAALAQIHRLNPKPGAAYGTMRDEANYLIPDFNIGVDGDDIHISLSGNVPELALSESFSAAVAEMERRKRGERDAYVMNRYNDAREYLSILQRRRRTLMDVMAAIVDLQRPYLLSRGDESLLRPMALRDVAERTGMDISVVSRATKNKYAALPWATVPMRFFFSESFDGGSEGAPEISGRGVEQAIRRVVEQEDKRHPLSDDAVCRMLQQQGYKVSRRTVTKYRERLNILPARMRREG